MQRGWALSVVERSGRRVVLSDGWSDSGHVVWSPDDREVWFAAPKPCSTGSALYAVDRSGQRRLLAEGPGALDLSDIGPQGRALVVGGSVGGRTRGWVSGRQRETDLSSGAYSWPVDLTSDGHSTLLNVISPCAGGVQVPMASYLRTVDGAPAVRVGEGMADAVSPDGRFVLAAEPGGVRVIPVGPGSPRSLALGFELPTAVFGAVRVLPSGNEIAAAAADTGGQLRLHVIGIEDGRTRQLSAPFSPDGSTQSWLSPPSPDGRLIAARGGDGGVLLVPLDGAPPRPLPGSEPNDVPVQWSPDGRTLFVFHPGERPAPVRRVDVVTGRRTPWREIQPPDMNATGIGQLFLSRDGRAGVYSFGSFLVDLYLVDGLR